MRRNVVLGNQALPPASQQNHRRACRGCLDRGGDSPAIDVRHTQVCDDDRERVACGDRVGEGIDAGLPAVGHGDLMAIALQNVFEGLDQHGIVVNQQNTQPLRHQRGRHPNRRARIRRSLRKDQAEGAAVSRLAVDLQLGAMPLHHAVDHRKSEPAAAVALRREEGLETAPPRRLIHADSGIAHLDVNLAASVRDLGLDEPGAQSQFAALRHGIDGVEDEVRERIAQFSVRHHDLCRRRRKLGVQIDHDAALLGQIAPARVREVDRLLNSSIQVDPRKRQLRFALPVEFAHAGDGTGDIVDRSLDRRQVTAGAIAEVRFAFEQRFSVERYGRDRVVDVMRDAAGHLPECAQPLLLHHRLLGLA